MNHNVHVKTKTTTSHDLVCAQLAMSVADLLVAMVSVMTDIIWRITEHWYAGAAMCKIVRYLQVHRRTVHLPLDLSLETIAFNLFSYHPDVSVFTQYLSVCVKYDKFALSF